jgi:hypothetical protein
LKVKVLLKDIVDALEMQMDDELSFVNLDTGEVHTLSRAVLSEAEESDEEEPEEPELEDDEWELAKRIIANDRFVRLPTKFDIHEWSIMENFAFSLRSDRIREEILDSIHGAGAFRVFKSTIRRLKIEAEWFAFRDEALKEIAIDWCEEHHVEWA